jgi:hypothetical protein
MAGGTVRDGTVTIPYSKLLQYCAEQLHLTSIDVSKAHKCEPHVHILTETETLLWSQTALEIDKYPAWWNVETDRQREILRRKNIQSTQDLLLRAGGTANEDRIVISFCKLFKFCNRKLDCMHLDIQNAPTQERGLCVIGNRFDRYLRWMPMDEDPTEEPTAKEPADQTNNPQDASDETLDEWWTCPLTLEPFVDPVVASDGHTYERTAIEEWLSRKQTSPLTGVALSSPLLFPNIALRALVRGHA